MVPSPKRALLVSITSNVRRRLFSRPRPLVTSCALRMAPHIRSSVLPNGLLTCSFVTRRILHLLSLPPDASSSIDVPLVEYILRYTYVKLYMAIYGQFKKTFLRLYMA